jgi:hypothetical protein
MAGWRAVFVSGVSALSACANNNPVLVAVPDAGPVNCVADYAEQNPALNDPRAPGGGSEMTPLMVTAGGATSLCGLLDASFARQGDLDADFYAFAVTGAAPVPVRIELTVQGLVPGQIARVELWTPQLGRLLGSNVLGSVAFIEPGTLAPGRYLVSVTLDGTAPPAPLPYKVWLRGSTPPCMGTGTPAYQEGDESPTFHVNDAVAIAFLPMMTASLIPGSTSEPTGLVLNAGTSLVLAGLSDAVPSTGDAYRDRDTFAFAVGANVNEIEAHLTWPHPGLDLDMFLFGAGDPSHDSSQEEGSLVSTDVDEAFDTPVLPGQMYWIWVGAADSGDLISAQYQVTLCGRNFVPTP